MTLALVSSFTSLDWALVLVVLALLLVLIFLALAEMGLSRMS